ncbi:hypothetical protein [Pinibacter soli]|uniref:Uncharacterized protein n=1 Tax=Pinibacter soli TaxID=3044211 RepID=A0ABT6RCQ5_9BACT|nr:hypothetical protein [Pinibacter soli]MDI3319652.1 hypothetical protein [Pinibacter soli]
MLITYFKITLQNLSGSKLISGIDLFGVAIATACCLIMLLYILTELSFDKHQSNTKDIYIIRSENYWRLSRKKSVAIVRLSTSRLKTDIQNATWTLNMNVAKTSLQIKEGKDCQYQSACMKRLKTE